MTRDLILPEAELRGITEGIVECFSDPIDSPNI
jgi:hypothetical protein